MLKVAMAQINSTLGDLKGNINKINKFIKDAKNQNADLVVFPELAITGYPPQDLLLEKGFIENNKKSLKEMIYQNSVDIVGVVGFVDSIEGNLFNAAAIFKGNRLVDVIYKSLLPTYDVFDEDRYFKPADEINPVSIKINDENFKLGIEICEDLWDNNYDLKVTDVLVKKGAQLIINISASPFLVGKHLERKRLLRKKAIKNGVPIFYVNLIGGQDELVFDGNSMAFDNKGNLIAFGKQFDEDLIITEIDLKKDVFQKIETPYMIRPKKCSGL